MKQKPHVLGQSKPNPLKHDGPGIFFRVNKLTEM